MERAQHRLFSRRAALVVAAASVALGGYTLWSSRRSVPEGVGSLSVEAAHQAAQSGDILLVDIRRPDEWRATGIGAGALPLDLRRPDFVAALDAATGGDRSRAVALICARGVRSARLSRVLAEAGFTRLVDVPEGMLGSRAGAGWLAKGLPVVRTP